MNIFSEFHKILQHLQREKIEYALVGAVAMAFHTTPRFTRDIDILIRKSELEKIRDIMTKEGYFESSSPWTFKDTEITLHRFFKAEGEDHMMVDIMVAGSPEHEHIIEYADEAVSARMGSVRVASREDLVWMKRIRNSKQDQADIEKLLSEEDQDEQD